MPEGSVAQQQQASSLVRRTSGFATRKELTSVAQELQAALTKIEARLDQIEQRLAPHPRDLDLDSLYWDPAFDANNQFPRDDELFRG